MDDDPIGRVFRKNSELEKNKQQLYKKARWPLGLLYLLYGFYGRMRQIKFALLSVILQKILSWR
jgi:hypothetical protein